MGERNSKKRLPKIVIAQPTEAEKEMEESYKSARGFKSWTRKLVQEGIHPRLAAKIALQKTDPDAGKKKKKVSASRGIERAMALHKHTCPGHSHMVLCNQSVTWRLADLGLAMPAENGHYQGALRGRWRRHHWEVRESVRWRREEPGGQGPQDGSDW